MIREAIIVATALTMTACTPRPRMCTSTSECSAESACVGGRCQSGMPTVKPAVDTAKRLVARPVDMAYVRPGDRPSDGALPPIVALGHEGAALLLRFEVAVPAGSNVVEAYLVLRRSDAVDDDPSPISLHVTRIVDAWEGRSTSWAFQPRFEEFRAPATTVEPGGPSLVRLDVRDLARRWARRDGKDQGLAVVAGKSSRAGTAFAILSGTVVEPYLELYVR